MGQISSPANPLFKRIRKALDKGTLTDDGLAVAEGPKLLLEALRSGVTVDRVLVEAGTARLPSAWTGPVDELDPRIFRELKDTQHSQGVLALVRPPVLPEPVGTPLVVFLDGIQDPGNLGTIVRSAEAFGATQVVCLKGCVHPWNPKVLRASAGSVFRLPIRYAVDDVSEFSVLPWYGAVAAGGSTINLVDLSTACGIWIGNEGTGLGSNWRERCTSVQIPTAHVESLNAAVAASVILYEAHRQRAANSSVFL
ncbi:rRNA methyltransferase [Bryobacterales bacterium F-183]|nr:rRNA methyltransferase [Bryobacterales bacterium F-183]